MPFTYKYARPEVTVDIIVNRFWKNQQQVLLIKRAMQPFAGKWALPGGFMEMDETLEQAAIRELTEETKVRVKRLAQVGAFSAVERDPRGRVISVAFVAKVSASTRVQSGDDAAQVVWFNLQKLPPMAFDHKQIIATAKKHKLI